MLDYQKERLLSLKLLQRQAKLLLIHLVDVHKVINLKDYSKFIIIISMQFNNTLKLNFKIYNKIFITLCNSIFS